MRAGDFSLFADLVKKQSGIHLTEDKAYLLESRLMTVARKHNLENLEDLADSLRRNDNRELGKDITEAMTTNESSFFRDQRPFDQFRNFVLPRLLTARRDKRLIRIWSAACSSGQEPYSLAMILKEEQAKLAGWRVDIVATDISDEMIEKAKHGEYTQFEVQRGLPIQMLVKYFDQVGDKWVVKEDLRKAVTFKPFNLMEEMGQLGIFDVIFCRNVLIYFDAPTKTTVLEKLSRRLPEDGLLFLGGAETIIGVSDRFKAIPDQRGVFDVVANGPPGSNVLLKQHAEVMA
ncbi:MAG: protein-glutamate O-methyltransferase [Alphaproteobacteria bacterium]|nr:protein-glutamate O-methyltransferase [Alphaproteobacteria bacterium SS10]